MQPTIQHHTEPTHINSILNHPEVHGWVASNADPIDIAPLVSDPNTFALFGEHGGQIYCRLQPGLFDVHSAFVPEGRGEWSLAATHKTLAWIFARTEACEVVTRVPQGNLGARALARAAGLTQDCTLAHGWVRDGKPIPADVFSLTIQGWMKSAPGLVERGRWFHDRLKSELDRLGISEDQHDDDIVHDRYVGAACEMVFGGQPQKACIFYNRIAALAGWQQISIVNVNPLAVDIGSAIIMIRGDDFFVIPPQKQ